MTEEQKRMMLDRMADILDAEISSGMAYVLVVTEKAKDGTDFATCTNVDEAGVLYVAECIAKDMKLALMVKGQDQ